MQSQYAFHGESLRTYSAQHAGRSVLAGGEEMDEREDERDTAIRPPRLRRKRGTILAACALLLAGCVFAPVSSPGAGGAAGGSAAPVGELKGHAVQHTAASRVALVQGAHVALPAVGARPLFFGKWREVPAAERPRVPVVLLLHGSSGLALKALEDWQRWLAELGVASVAPDSFALPGRLTYKSPVDKVSYEQIHALRASEIEATLDALRGAPWADPARIVLAGTSEGAVAVARHEGAGFAGRILFAWSCEDNYFVQAHRTAPAPALPVLNVISANDPFFSAGNGWIGNPWARGHCAAALATHPRASIVLIPGAPHTLLNLPPARHAVAGFVQDVLRP
jgi:dienelactone hydrolase